MMNLLRAMTLGLILFSGRFAEANLIVDGGFESPAHNGVLYVANVDDASVLNGLEGWRISSGNHVDLVAKYWDPHSGAQSLDLAGSPAQIGGYVEQTFKTTIGESYLLTFFYANNKDADKAMGQVDILGSGSLYTSSLQHSGSTEFAMDYTMFTQVFVANSTSTTLRFTHLGAEGGVNNPTHTGLVLDDVSVIGLSSIVPEPSSFVLFSIAGIGLLGRSGKQRRSAKPAKDTAV